MPVESPYLVTEISFLLQVDASRWTREIFGNIPSAAKALFYCLATLSLSVFVFGVYRRVRLYRLGRAQALKLNGGEILKRVLQDILMQRKVRGRGIASLAHLMLLSGFLVLFLGTLLIAVEHILASILGRSEDDPVFHQGIYYAVYEILMDGFGVIFLLGCLLFAWRRLRSPQSVGYRRSDWAVLCVMFVIGVSGFALEGLRIIREQTPQPGFSYLGLLCANMLQAVGISHENVSASHFSLWWFHALLALGLIGAFPFLRLKHALAGSISLAIGERRLGVMEPISMEQLEEKGFVGVETIQDFSQQQLLQLDACVSCGRCEDTCPAFAVGKPLSPRDVVQDIRIHLDQVDLPAITATKTGQEHRLFATLHEEVISAETLWSCTTCSACIEVCPLGVRPLELITDMRRFLIGEGELRGAPAIALQKTSRSGNPWGLPAEERFDWAEGLEVPTVESRPDFEVLYWVGCAAAYDRRIQKIARSVVQLLSLAKVRFAVLGSEERCTGDSARRMGDEFLFQELAEANIKTLKRRKVRKILTHCPHCLNSLKNDYSQFGGSYEVIHHSQFLSELVEQGKISVDKLSSPDHGTITYHDPCYLARVQEITQPPRTLVQLTLPDDSGSIMKEMSRREQQTACCGAGGGRMWMDDDPDHRIGTDRIEEVLATGAATVAVACPFCLTMMRDGVAAAGKKVQVLDVAELLVQSLSSESSNNA